MPSIKPTWTAPLLFLPARSALLVIGQASFAVYAYWQGYKSPWSAAAAWWTVWGTIADIGCLAILFVLTRREGLSIRSLAGTVCSRFLLTGIGYFFIVFPISVLGTLLVSYLFFGSFLPRLPLGEVSARHLPLWAALYSLIVWPVIWSTTEELTYNGYLVPRIVALSGHRWVALILVGFWWAAQHSFLPLVLDWRFAVWRFVSFVPGVAALMVLYLRSQRLTPVIVAHWIMDVIAAATTLSYAHAAG